MKRIAMVGIITLAACRTAAPVAEQPPASPQDAFAAVEASLEVGEQIERMHRDGEQYVALLAAEDGAEWRIVRVRNLSGTWTIIETKTGSADYLWPVQ